MKKLIFAAACILLTGMITTVVMARPAKRYDAKTQSCRVLDTGPLEWESLPWGKGGKGFQQVCQSCHSSKNEGKAPFLFTEIKSGKGWNRIFAERRVECARDGSWNKLSEEELQMVNDYLYSWSSTSLDRNDSA